MIHAREAKTIADDTQILDDTDRTRLHNEITREAQAGKTTIVVRILKPSMARLVAIKRYLERHGYTAVIGMSARNEDIDWLTVSWDKAK